MAKIFSWLNRRLVSHADRAAPQLTAIYIAGSAGEPMQSLVSVQVIEQRGIQGDRYSQAKGFWQVTEACQVTLIGEEDLSRGKKRAAAGLRDKLEHGHHRRNLVIGRLKSRDLQGKRFRIGEAEFRYDKPRPQCGYLDKIEGKGLATALGKHSGICVTVVRGGLITVGDRLELLPE